MKVAILAAAGVLAMLIGYGAGRYAQPARVEVREKVITKTVEVAATTKESASVSTSKTDIRSVTHWRIRYLEKPDGTVERTAEGDSGQSTEHAQAHEEAKRETEVRYVDRFVDREKVVIKTSERPGWAIGAQVGSSASRLAGHDPGLRSLVYGGAVERRLIGPAWVTAYGTSTAELGIGLRWEF